eukprot:1326626-Rhodomonas_salina.1
MAYGGRASVLRWRMAVPEPAGSAGWRPGLPPILLRASYAVSGTDLASRAMCIQVSYRCPVLT